MNKKTKHFLINYMLFILIGITMALGIYILYAEDNLPLEARVIFPKWFPVFKIMTGVSMLYAAVLIGFLAYNHIRLNKKKSKEVEN